MRCIFVAAALVALTSGVAPGDEKLKGIACRSVHLAYPSPEGVAFYNEVTVEKSADGTYFMAAGWSKGYFGIQELANGKKLVLFSVWEPTAGNDPKKVNEADRVKMLYKDDLARVQRFGGEGAGGQCFFDYDWKVGETYRFLITAKRDGETRTEYSGWFFLPEKKEWKRLVAFSTLTNGALLKGCYSFIEDFRRNKVSATKERRASFSNGWLKPVDGDWTPLDTARFTADSNPVLNIDAGAAAGSFFLATGGDIENKTTKLRAVIRRGTDKADLKPPTDLPKLELR